MTEIPEHLRKRAEAARAKAEAEKGEAAAADAPAARRDRRPTRPSRASPPTSSSAAGPPRPRPKVARRPRPAVVGVAVAERPSAVTAVGPAAAGGVPVGAGPGGHTQRLLTVVKSGSIQDVKATPVDKVHTWPHLLAGEFVASLICLAFTFVFSVFVNAPLLQLANPNRTPNPSKAPWYFLGLQELLTMFHPMVAGVTIPGMGLILLAVTPYVDRNPSNKPEDRKFAISVFTIFMMFWAVLVLIGSFFRGPGQNFVLPWRNGIFFDL